MAVDVSVMTEDRFRLLTEAAPVGMFECDAQGKCLYTNPAWQEITQLRGAEGLGEGWERMVHPDDLARVRAEWSAAQLAATTLNTRFRVVPGDDGRWVDACAVPTIAHGEVIGWVGTLVEITATLEAERTSNAARDRAVDASRLKSEFVANISHEIRTPLNAVLGLAEILAGTNLDEKQLSYVDTLRRAGDDLLTLLNDILDLSKIEAGAMRVEAVPFDLEAMVQATADLFAPSARSKGLDFAVVAAPGLTRQLIGDWPRLRQVVSNLVSNAIKFTDTGGVEVHIATTARAGGTVELAIAVADTGPGIDDADRERVFDVFGQADSSPTRRSRGSGLGLPISRQILDLMKGTLSLESVVGEGSVFTARVLLETGRQRVDAPAREETSDVVKRRVLVVEDNAVNQLVLQTLLTSQGCEVELADDGVAGAVAAADTDFDLIFMDCQMPRMDGYEATAAIRAMPGSRGSVPIVALTASAMPADRQRCLDAGMDDYLSKPVSRAALSEVLQRLSRAEAVNHG
jgi:PAS domain S-box-containing protein